MTTNDELMRAMVAVVEQLGQLMERMTANDELMRAMVAVVEQQGQLMERMTDVAEMLALLTQHIPADDEDNTQPSGGDIYL